MSGGSRNRNSKTRRDKLDETVLQSNSNKRDLRHRTATTSSPRVACSCDPNRLASLRSPMSSLKQLKQSEKSALQQQQVIQELKTIVKDIERCEKTIHDLQRELTAVNSRYPVPRTTREDIAYLT